MSTPRIEPVNMIKTVGLLGVPESFAKLYPMPRSTAVSYVVTMKFAKETQAMLFFLNASSSPVHLFKTKTNCESSKRASTFEGKADSSEKHSGGSDARNGAG